MLDTQRPDQQAADAGSRAKVSRTDPPIKGSVNNCRHAVRPVMPRKPLLVSAVLLDDGYSVFL